MPCIGWRGIAAEKDPRTTEIVLSMALVLLIPHHGKRLAEIANEENLE